MFDNKDKRETISYSFRASLPVMAGYVVLGMGFGLLLSEKGYAWYWALFMSIAIFAGSMQYVAIDLLSGGATLIAAAIMTIMVNIRHIFYGITMLDEYKKTGPEKPYLIFALSDETFSLVCSPNLPDQVSKRGYYLCVSFLNQCYWVIGSVVGAVIGNTFTFQSAGVDFSMTALFVVIFVEQWESQKNHLPAISGVMISLICLLIFGASDFLIPSMVCITLAMFLGKRWMLKEDET